MPLPRRLGRLVGAVAVVAVAVGACGSRSAGRDEVIADLAEIVADADVVGEEERLCVATRLVDELGIDRARDLDIDARRRVVDPDLRVTVIDAYRACDALAPLLEPPS